MRTPSKAKFLLALIIPIFVISFFLVVNDEAHSHMMRDDGLSNKFLSSPIMP